MDIKQRYQLYCNMVDELDEGCRLITEYDSVPHTYGAETMYQAESQLIHMVGKHPGITAGEIAELLKKTPSACSQLIRKLRKKEWMEQILNKDNNRQYQLHLTEAGWKIYQAHDTFEQACYQRSFHNLDEFSDAELETYIAIQKKLNETFAMDVAESKNI